MTKSNSRVVPLVDALATGGLLRQAAVRVSGVADIDAPGWDDRKDLLDVWQEHAPLPDVDLRAGIFDALIAVAEWGYRRRLEQEGHDS